MNDRHIGEGQKKVLELSEKSSNMPMPWRSDLQTELESLHLQFDNLRACTPEKLNTFTVNLRSIITVINRFIQDPQPEIEKLIDFRKTLEYLEKISREMPFEDSDTLSKLEYIWRYRNAFAQDNIKGLIDSNFSYSLEIAVCINELKENLQKWGVAFWEEIENSTLLLHNKESILAVINHAYPDMCFEQRMDNFRRKNQLPEFDYEEGAKAYIKQILERDKLERGIEKSKLEAKEAETRAQVQKDNFVTINHSIKNLISSVDGALSRLERRLPSDQEFMCNLLKQAKQGVVIASDLANAITCSYRSTGTELWHEDILSENAKWSVQDILHDALSASIPHIFFRRYSQYEQESKNYFPDKDEGMRAEHEWYDLSDINVRIAWINQHLFRFELNDSEVAACKVGNKYSTKTHLYVLFNEILLNAIKAASFVDKEQRNIKVSLTSAGGNIIVDISNSANPNRGISGGYGKIIIDNYKSMFNMLDFYSGYNADTKCYQVKFILPFSK